MSLRGERMEPEIEWSDAYDTGLPEIDAQHRALAQLVNRISDRSGRSEALASVLHVFRYAREHFATEELLMRQIGFPGLEKHLLEHRELIAALANAADGTFATAQEIRAFKGFLANWLLDHIAQSDLEIRRYLDSTKA